jgi:hypothetical protein
MKMLKKLKKIMKFRKNVLALVISVIALNAAAFGQSVDSNSSRRSIEGTWKVTVTPGPAPVPLPPSIESFVTYIPGGGLTEIDNLAVPGSTATTGVGAWEHTRGREYKFSFVKYQFTSQGLNNGSVRIIETFVLHRHKDEYTGVGRIEVLSPTGAVVLVIPVTSRAERIVVDE